MGLDYIEESLVHNFEISFVARNEYIFKIFIQELIKREFDKSRLQRICIPLASSLSLSQSSLGGISKNQSQGNQLYASKSFVYLYFHPHLHPHLYPPTNLPIPTHPPKIKLNSTQPSQPNITIDNLPEMLKKEVTRKLSISNFT